MSHTKWVYFQAMPVLHRPNLNDITHPFLPIVMFNNMILCIKLVGSMCQKEKAITKWKSILKINHLVFNMLYSETYQKEMLIIVDCVVWRCDVGLECHICSINGRIVYKLSFWLYFWTNIVVMNVSKTWFVSKSSIERTTGCVCVLHIISRR